MSDDDFSHDNYDDFDGPDDGRRGRDDDPLGLKRRGGKRRAPSFTAEKGFRFDYKDAQQLRHFISDRGKVASRRISGLSAKQQRDLTRAIRRARNIALLPYASIE